MDNNIKKSLAIEWVDTMEDKLSAFETQRNEFLADYHLPPKNLMFYREVVLPFCENTLIMDNIAASEGLMYKELGQQNKLKIRVFIDGDEIIAKYPNLASFNSENDKEISYPDNFPFLIYNKEIDQNGKYKPLSEALNNKNLYLGNGNPAKDIEIAIPNEHAFYSILENFIRNSAKHNKKEFQNQTLDICLDIVTGVEDYYHITLYDNVSSLTTQKIWDIIERKRKNILDDHAQFRRENLGMADMKINAHILQSSEDVTEKNLKDAVSIVIFCNQSKQDYVCSNCFFYDTIPIKSKEDIENAINTQSISPFKEEKNNKENESLYRFGYRFKLSKSKKICWIGKEYCNNTETLKNSGIYLFEGLSAFNIKKGKSLSAYEFAIIEPEILQNVQENALEDLLLSLPFRILVNDSKAPSDNSILQKLKIQKRLQYVNLKIEIPLQNAMLSEDAPFKIMEQCWENWLQRWQPSTEISYQGKVIVHFDETPSNEWKDIKEWQNKGTSKILIRKQQEKTTLPKEVSFSDLLNTYRNQSETTQISALRNMYYLHHGQGIEGKPKFNLPTDFYVDFGKSNPDYFRITSTPPTLGSFIGYELFEAGCFNILVIDERILEFANVKANPPDGNSLWIDRGFTEAPLRNFSFLWAANVFVATHINDRPINQVNTGSHFLKINNSVTNKKLHFSHSTDLTDAPLNFDAVIIHRTFLNDEYKEDFRAGLDTENFINQLYDSIPLIILDSGGSYPHGIPGKYKFISVHSITNYLVNDRGIGKLGLTKELIELVKNQYA